MVLQCGPMSMASVLASGHGSTLYRPVGMVVQCRPVDIALQCRPVNMVLNGQTEVLLGLISDWREMSTARGNGSTVYMS